MTDHTQPHEQKRTLSEDELLLGHGERNHPRFEHSRHLLIVVQKTPCWLCGATEHLEAHHSPIEFSRANEVDWSAAGKIRQDFPDFDWHAFDAAGQDPSLFIDTPINLMILCRPCHIGLNRGVHAKTWPNVVIRRYARADIALTPEDVK